VLFFFLVLGFFFVLFLGCLGGVFFFCGVVGFFFFVFFFFFFFGFFGFFFFFFLWGLLSTWLPRGRIILKAPLSVS